jgi:Glycerophosphoryl diester phosphodiesterase family
MRRAVPALVCAVLWCVALDAAVAGEAPLVIAHRGGAGLPENSLAACRASLALGAGCELDVRRTRDGALVLMHDATISRTTTGRGRVKRLTLAELRGFELRSESGASGERVPALEDALALPFDQRVLLLDLKEDSAAFHAALASALGGAAAPTHVWVGVQSEGQAHALRSLLPASQQVAFIDHPREIERLAEAGAEWIRLWDRWLADDAGLAARVDAAGPGLLVGLEGQSEAPARAAVLAAPRAILCDLPALVLGLVARAR